MANVTNSNWISNIIVFVFGALGVYNLIVALRHLKYGTKFEELLKENHDLKNEIIGLKERIKALDNYTKENDRSSTRSTQKR